jgi:hypothetical protein
MAAEPGRVMGIDYGSRRVGIAVSDPLRIITRGLGALDNVPGLIESIAAKVREEQVVLIVVGMPFAPDGGPGAKGEEVGRFIEALRAVWPSPSRYGMRASPPWMRGGPSSTGDEKTEETGKGARRRNGGDAPPSGISGEHKPSAEMTQGAGPSGPGELAPDREPHRPFPRRITGWMRKHKILTALLLILASGACGACQHPLVCRGADEDAEPGRNRTHAPAGAEAEAAGKPFRVTQTWIPLSRIPKRLVDAVIVAEDGTFFTHGGVDWFEVRESLEKDIHEGRAARGASTITQQLAKNLFLSTSKDPVRKVKELIITFLMEQELDKDRILEIYLNIVEWGPGFSALKRRRRPTSALMRRI